MDCWWSARASVRPASPAPMMATLPMLLVEVILAVGVWDEDEASGGAGRFWSGDSFVSLVVVFVVDECLGSS